MNRFSDVAQSQVVGMLYMPLLSSEGQLRERAELERLLNLKDLFTRFLKGDPAAGFVGVSACGKCSACTDLTARFAGLLQKSEKIHHHFPQIIKSVSWKEN